MPDRHGWQADALYSALDGRQVGSLGRFWQIRVYGIFEDNDLRWVQAALIGTPVLDVVVRLSSTVDPRGVLEAIGAWLTDRQILHVCASNVLER
jgi:hypothetical protein